MFDYHMHSTISRDGKSTALEMVQAAQAAGGAGFDPNANPGTGAQGGDGTYYNADFEDKSDN